MNDTDKTVEVVDISADRPALSDRGDSGVVHPSTPSGVNYLTVTPQPLSIVARHYDPVDPVDPIEAIASMTDEELMAEAGVEPIFSTSEAAEFFDRSNQWLYWGLREKVFVDEHGEPLIPDWVGDMSRGRRRFTIPIIREIARSSYRRGNFDLEHLKRVMIRARYAELGIEWREKEGWKQIPRGRGFRWVHPDRARRNPVTKKWEEIKSGETQD